MEIVCSFVQQDEDFYYYRIFNHDIPEKAFNLKVIHPPRKSNKDVKYLNIDNCRITKIPQGLTKIFPNLDIFDIENTNLEKVYKTDLAEYKNLREFFCDFNKIEFLAGNMFEDFKNIERISFNGNKIKLIEPTILDGLDSLTHADFNNNVNYIRGFSNDDKSGDSTLDEIKNNLFEKFFSSNPQDIKNFIKKFQNKIHRLTISNDKLRTKIQKLEESDQKLRVVNLKLKNENQDYATVKEQFIFTDAHQKRQIMILENIETNLTKEIQQLKQLEKDWESKLSSKPQNSFHLDIKKYIQNEKFKDFRIQIDDREFQVHKFLFAARSPTLADIFFRNPEAENLKLVDISAETFEQIFHFIYTDELPSDKGTNFLQLYSAAGRLGISELKNIAEPMVLKNITPENAIEVLIVGHKFKNNEIRQKAFDEIKKEHPDVPDNWIDKPEKVKKFIEVFGES